MRSFCILFQAAISTILIAANCCGQGTFRIAFDAPPLPAGTSKAVTNYVENGMSFTPLPGAPALGRVGPDDGSGFPRSGFPDNGSTYLSAALGGSLNARFVSSSVFNVVSVDLAEYSIAFQSPATVHIVGYRPDGSMVMVDFTTDGVIDGTGPLGDFQTFHFDSSWTGLTRVEVPTSPWSLDNFVVSIPEPNAGTLLFMGGFVFCVFKRVRSKHR